MTRFEKEISGQLGQWWKEHAEKEVAKAVAMATTDAIVEESGAIKWKVNGSYIPDDFCEKLEYAGYDFSREATSNAREAQLNEFFEEYKRNSKGYSEEEIAELRSVHGPGTKVVDIITGQTIQL